MTKVIEISSEEPLEVLHPETQPETDAETELDDEPEVFVESEEVFIEKTLEHELA